MTPEPEWVDLGLPSGLLWAKANLGATRPESAGIYFSWGNTEGHPAGAGYNFSQAVYDETPAAAITEDLSLNQDAARAILGSPWRMPTAAEFTELRDNCTFVWTTLNGVYGLLFTSNVNGNTLFIPAAGEFTGTTLVNRDVFGYYWASSIVSDTNARALGFNDSTVTPSYSSARYFGYSVRAVREA